MDSPFLKRRSRKKNGKEKKPKNGTEQHPGLGKAIKHLKNKSLKEKIRQEKVNENSKF